MEALIALFIILASTLANVYWSRRKSRNPYLWGFLGFIAPFISNWILDRLSAGTYGWPTLAQYMERNPNCKTGQGISCCHCGSKQIRSWGRSGVGDSSRLQSCNHCGAGLYHT